LEIRNRSGNFAHLLLVAHWNLHEHHGELLEAGLDVVVEGRAERVTDDATLRALAAMWETKYDGDWRYDVRDGAFSHEAGEAHVFEVRPRKVLSFAKGDFAQTRFRFDG
jgi:hypothetical protein